jgi:hypothetical protein
MTPKEHYDRLLASGVRSMSIAVDRGDGEPEMVRVPLTAETWNTPMEQLLGLRGGEQISITEHPVIKDPTGEGDFAQLGIGGRITINDLPRE